MLNQEFLQHIKEQHGVELTEEELEILSEFHFKRSNELRVKLLNDPSLVDPDVEDGKILFAVVGGAVGLFAAPLLGLSLISGVLAGAAIGFRIGGLFEKKRTDEEKESARTFGFDSVTSLAPIGGRVPLIYCNRTTNPNGGARASGFLIHVRVDTNRNSQKLYLLHAYGYGQLGSVKESEMLIDNQPRSTFFANEVRTFVRLGTKNQVAIAQFPYYCQCVSPSTNATLGVDRRSVVKSSSSSLNESAATLVVIQGGYVASSNPTDFVKNTDTVAQANSTESISSGDGYAEMTVLTSDRQVALSLYQGGGDNAFIRMRSDGHFQVEESGVIVFESGSDPDPDTYSVNDTFRIEFSANTVAYKRNGNTFYTSARIAFYPVQLAVYIVDEGVSVNGTRLHNIRIGQTVVTSAGAIEAGNGTTIRVDEDDIDRFSPSDNYRANGIDFKIIDKNTDAFLITADKALNLAAGTEIFAVYKATYQTTKPVSELHFNMVAQLWARDDENKLMRHALCFDLYIRPIASPTFLFLHRLYISNKSQGDVRRYFKIKNLPLDRYDVHMVPVERATGGLLIRALDSNGAVLTVPTGVTIGGQAIALEIEQTAAHSQPEAKSNGHLSYKDKEQVSTESGPPCRITTVNEVVLPSAIGQPSVTAYPGLSLSGKEFLASDRLQGSPNTSDLIERGLIIRQHLAAGTCHNSSSGSNLYDLSANFTGDSVTNGNTLRNLSKGIESEITAVAATTLTTVDPLVWEAGDRYLVYNMGSSNRFPDIFADSLANVDYGLGKLINPDFAIDYVSLVRSRKFCVANGFFWDGQVTEAISWAQWASREAFSSLLFPSRIGGRFALVPEDLRTPSGLFNASNIIDGSFTEETTQRDDVNSLNITYADGEDGRFEPKSVTVMTEAAYNGLEPIVEETLNLAAVTNRYQAQQVGIVSLQSKLRQDVNISFRTNLAGMYVEPGDLIIVQHIITESDAERDGFIVAAGTFNAGTQQVRLSVPVSGEIDSSYSVSTLSLATGAIQRDIAVSAIAASSGTELVLSGLTTALQGPSENRPGDYVILGREIEEKRTYRVQVVEPQGDGTFTISAVRWTPEILTSEGLRVVY